MLWLQKIAGEPWLWSIRPAELGLFLPQTGWREIPEIAGAKDKNGVEFFVLAAK